MSKRAPIVIRSLPLPPWTIELVILSAADTLSKLLSPTLTLSLPALAFNVNLSIDTLIVLLVP